MGVIDAIKGVFAPPQQAQVEQAPSNSETYGGAYDGAYAKTELTPEEQVELMEAKRRVQPRLQATTEPTMPEEDKLEKVGRRFVERGQQTTAAAYRQIDSGAYQRNLQRSVSQSMRAVQRDKRYKQHAPLGNAVKIGDEYQGGYQVNPRHYGIGNVNPAYYRMQRINPNQTSVGIINSRYLGGRKK